MTDNIYADFFSELKHFLIVLDIDSEQIAGCSDEQIMAIEQRIGNILPTSYKDYLKSMGRNCLFDFFDAEQMSFEDYEDIDEYVSRTLSQVNFTFEREFFPISHRRYDFFRFFYLNESDNPDIWFFDEYPQNGEHTENSGQTFIQMILIFFSEILNNKTAGFHWASDEDIKNNENIVRDRYLQWFEANLKLKDHILQMKTDNPFILELYERFNAYLNPQNERNAIEQLKKYKKNAPYKSKSGTGTTKQENNTVIAKQGFWNKLKEMFS